MTDYNESRKMFTPEQDMAMIKFRFKDKKSYKEIGYAMGYNSSQISGRINELRQTNDSVKELHAKEIQEKERFRRIRDEKIISMLEAGYQSKVISEELGVTINTIRNVKSRWRYENNLSESWAKRASIKLGKWVLATCKSF